MVSTRLLHLTLTAARRSARCPHRGVQAQSFDRHLRVSSVTRSSLDSSAATAGILGVPSRLTNCRAKEDRKTCRVVPRAYGVSKGGSEDTSM